MTDELRPATIGVSERDWSVLVSWWCESQDELFECERPTVRSAVNVQVRVNDIEGLW